MLSHEQTQGKEVALLGMEGPLNPKSRLKKKSGTRCKQTLCVLTGSLGFDHECRGVRSENSHRHYHVHHVQSEPRPSFKFAP